MTGSLPETADERFTIEPLGGARSGLTLHLRSSAIRKTNRLCLFSLADLDDDVTLRALLPNVMLRGTRTYPDMQLLSQRLEYLYGSSVVSEVMKIGERHVFSLRAEFVNDRYLPAGQGVLAPVIALCGELMFAPHLESDLFPAPTVEQEKDALRRTIEGLVNSKSAYAAQRCLEIACADEPFRLNEDGRVEDLPSIGPSEITKMWQRAAGGAETHIYFSGDFELAAARAALAPFADWRRAHRQQFGIESLPLSPIRPLRAAPAKPREHVEHMDVHQTQLVLCFRTGVRYGHPRLEALTIANGVLGLFPHSKLFQNVREKASLCYSVHSTLERSHGLLLITAGIKAEKRAEAESLILQQLDDVRGGVITDDELTATLLAFENRLLMLEDSPAALMDIDLTWRLSGVEYDHAAYAARLNQVTRADIMAAMREVQLDTVYVLAPPA